MVVNSGQRKRKTIVPWYFTIQSIMQGLNIGKKEDVYSHILFFAI